MEIYNWNLDWLINLVKFLMPVLIGYWSGCEASLKGAEKTNQLAREDKVYRLQEQIAYLSELYTNAMQTFEKLKVTQPLVWMPDIFIFETDYKTDLLYANLGAADKQKILSWFHQWERISKKMACLETGRNGFKQLGITFLQKECPIQNQQLAALLPDIEVILQRGISAKEK
ncbi:hypothetical protein [Acidaminococcus timonensis]|uniref:hypothetical protein n=1 Tax=Acidaminococcus timonensis TaxID=1871002 RepID=UPI0026F10A0B|nr:hypothetical protein [Acidaminococcus timonensis]